MSRFWFKTGIKYAGGSLVPYQHMFRAPAVMVDATSEILVGYASRKTGLGRGLKEAQ